MDTESPVNSEVSFFRDRGIVYYDSVEGTLCPGCESGEVYMPMQTAVPPNVYRCLRCGNVEKGREFRQ